MRNLIGLLAAAAIVVPASAGAQDKDGLAATYKALCSDDAAAATEACVALRQSMTGATPAAATTTAYTAPSSAAPLPELPTRPVQEAVIAAVDQTGPGRLPALGDAAPNIEAWGPLALLGGTYWLNEKTGGIRHYRWVIPGEVLEFVGNTSGRSFTDRLVLDATGIRIRATGTAPDGTPYNYTVVSPRPNVLVLESATDGWRLTERYSGNRRISQVENLKNGAWVAEPEPDEGRRISAAQAKAGIAVLAEYEGAAKAQAEALDARWGLLLKRVGKTYVQTIDGTNWLTSYQWKERGTRLLAQTQAWGQKAVYPYEYRFDAANNRVVFGSGDTASFITHQPDGAMVWVSANPKYAAKYRSFTRLRPDNSFETITEKQKGGTWRVERTYREIEYTQAVAARMEQQAQQARQAAQAQQSSGGGGGGGLFGALLGASMGALAGGNTEQVMGAAIKGVQMVDPGNQVGQALGGQADAMISGQGLNAGNALMSNMGLGGVTGVTGGGGGSYPTKPNLAAGSCPGFTESNYRSVALSGGSDVQLKTMCGQAFEFYTMYKRAIAQGYSEADANRTYAAHEGAVANLRSFAGN